MRTALVILTCVAALHAQESRSESRVATRPTDESRPGSPGDLVDADRVVEEGIDLQRQGRFDEALQCFARLGREFPDTHRTTSCLLMVQLHERRGDIDAAIEVIDRDLSKAGSEAEPAESVYGELGRLLERRGDWAKALEAWKRATPCEDSNRWDRESGLSFDQELGIARCEFHLGHVESTLKRLEGCLRRVRTIDGGVEAWLRRWEASRIAFAYAEYSGRSGRIATARPFAATLPPSLRALVLNSIRIVEAWLTKDPAAVARVAAENIVDPFLEGAGRLIGELGDDGIAFLARGIEAGDTNVVLLAGRSRRRELLPALEKRSSAEGEDYGAVTDAIARIEFATTRPASRPGR